MSGIAYSSQQARIQGFRRSSQRWVFSLVVVGLLLMMGISRGPAGGLAVMDSSSITAGDEHRQNSVTHNKDTVQVKPIRQISILGERNSGTRWTYRYVDDVVCCVLCCVSVLLLEGAFALS